MPSAAPHWDLFCRVVDNFGDAGVCWRLARMLADVHGIDVTLWIDRVDALARIVHGVDANAATQRVENVGVRQLDHAIGAIPAQAVIEAFGCGLPEPYLDAMERRPPVWVNLEYLSAEPWVDAAHGLASPQPQRSLTRWFYFPGFTPATGGLLREPELFARRAALLASRQGDALEISLFCYDNPALPALLETWAGGAEHVRLSVADGVAPGAFAHWLGHSLPAAPSRLARRALEIDVLPFVPQPAFDERLWRCDLNIVRGEDSFVRAQWAQKPLLWHIYPQDAHAHRAKLDAFLARYLRDVIDQDAQAARSLWHAFNTADAGALAQAWPGFRAALPMLDTHARGWSQWLSTLPELSAGLVKFVEMRYD
ncbi:MAG: elongation factor P maturation arginine rhamnosyltransferase EarP [Betaproteobacteria bacterium]